jgi:phosphate acetyltransferase
MWGSTLISTMLGTEFPGPGTVYVSQTLKFWRPITIGDTLTSRSPAIQSSSTTTTCMLECLCVNQDGLKVIDGIAEVMAPTEKIKRPRMAMPEVTISDRELRYRHVLSEMSARAWSRSPWRWPIPATRNPCAARSRPATPA